MSELPLKLLKDYLPGETFTGFALLQSITIRTKRDGGSFLAVEFLDRSGRIQGNVWEDAERLAGEFHSGDVVKLQGLIEEYEGRKKLNVRKIRKARPEDSVEPRSFLPHINGNPAELLASLRRLIGTVRNPFIAVLLNSIFNDERIADQFSSAPAGKLWHHNRIGGLLEHTLSLSRLVRRLSRHYPDIDRDVLIAGAMLHDIGKIEELRYDNFIDYTDRGRLVGHIAIGADLVANHIGRIEGFPDSLRDSLIHLVLSHQGEHGSPVLPATREAFLLHYADEIDSKMDALRRIAAEPGAGRWRFVKLLERWIDVGEDQESEEIE
jgi:3'-5' exoribonuclease